MNLQQLSAGAAVALALFATEAKAQTVTPQTVGGSVFVNGGKVGGTVSANGLDGVTASSSAIGSADVANGYGNYSSIDSITYTAPMDLLGSAILTNGTVSGNISTTSASNSAFSATSFGSYDLTNNVGEVDKFTVTGAGGTLTDQGIAQLTSVTAKGDVSATGAQNSTFIDAAVGNGDGVNNYGGLGSLQTGFTTAAAESFGNVTLNDSFAPSGNVVATGAIGSVVASTAAGYNDYSRSVGQVNEITYANAPQP